jgi:hypothetical protein
MTAKELIKNTTDLCHSVLKDYLADLSDADLMVRPVPGANHIAWQLGHLIVSEHGLTEAGYAMPALPDGFAEAYTKETAGSDDPQQFHTKAVYLECLEQQRTGTLAALDAMPDSDLDKPAPESCREYAPTVGVMFNLIGIHEMMHAAQFAVVRRKLGKTPLF